MDYPGVLNVITDILKSKRGMQKHQRDAKKEKKKEKEKRKNKGEETQIEEEIRNFQSIRGN